MVGRPMRKLLQSYRKARMVAKPRVGCGDGEKQLD